MAPKVSTWRRPYTSMYTNNYRFGTGLYADTLVGIEKRSSASRKKTHIHSDQPDLTFTALSGSHLTSSASPVGEIRETITYTRQPLSPSPMPEIIRNPTFENVLNKTLKNAASALDEDADEAFRARIEQRKQAIARSLSEAQKTENEEDDDFRRRMEIRKQALERAKFAAEIQSSKSATESEQQVTKSQVTKSQVTKSRKVTTEETPKPTSLYDDYTLFTLPKTKDKSMEIDLDISKSRRIAGGRQTPTNGPTSSRWKDKSRDLQDQVDSLERSMSDGGTRLKTELSSLKSKYHTELSDLSGSVENSTQQASDLQRLCKRQAIQLQELQSAYDSAQKNVQNVLEEMSVWQNKCKSLKKEMDRLREEVEMAVNKRGKA